MNFNFNLGPSAAGGDIEWTTVPNGHICISGQTGTGKSYLLKLLIPQAVRQGGRCIVFDFSGDFLAVNGNQPEGWPLEHREVVDVKAGKFSLNPFQAQDENEDAGDIADRVSAMLQAGTKLGPSQFTYITTKIAEGIEEGILENFGDLIYLVENEEETRDVAMRVLPKLKTLYRILPKGEKPISWNMDEPGLTILDLHHIRDGSAQMILTEMLLGDICGKRMAKLPDNSAYQVVICLDECQRMRIRDQSAANRILREGRKFGLCGWFSTQWIRSQEEEDILSQAALKVYFQMDGRERKRVLASLAIEDRKEKKQYDRLLASLQRGQFLTRDQWQLQLSETPEIS